jgi:hypothetical protein
MPAVDTRTLASRVREVCAALPQHLTQARRSALRDRARLGENGHPCRSAIRWPPSRAGHGHRRPRSGCLFFSCHSSRSSGCRSGGLSLNGGMNCDAAWRVLEEWGWTLRHASPKATSVAEMGHRQDRADEIDQRIGWILGRRRGPFDRRGRRTHRRRGLRFDQGGGPDERERQSTGEMCMSHRNIPPEKERAFGGWSGAMAEP